MISWIFIALLAYLFLALSSFGDKLVLSQKKIDALSPLAYTIYIGLLNILVIFLIPWIPFSFPTITSLPWIILNAIVFLLGIYSTFTALQRFDVSIVTPSIGAIQPILIFLFTIFFFGGQSITGFHFLAFIILLLGSIIISQEKQITFHPHYLFLVGSASLFFSLDYIFSKMVFLQEPFLKGLLWIRLFVFFFTLLLILIPYIRKRVFPKNYHANLKIGGYVLFAQIMGTLGVFCQSLAIALAPTMYLAIINAMRGIQYVFLFFVTLLSSLLFPAILQERHSWKIILKKVIAILIISTGLIILVASS